MKKISISDFKNTKDFFEAKINYLKKMRLEVSNAYCQIRETGNTIPWEVLDFMKNASYQKIDNLIEHNLSCIED